MDDISDIMPRDQNPFWYNMLRAWSRLNFSPDFTGDQIIWYNSCVKIGGKIVFWRKCFAAGLLYISQLFEDYQLINIFTAYQRFRLTAMEFNSLVSAIPKEWRGIYRSSSPARNHLYEQMLHKKNISSATYKMYKKCDSVPASKLDLWCDSLDRQITMKDFLRYFRRIYLVTNIPKLRSFQYRLQMRALVLNMHLYPVGITGKQSM